MLHGRRPRHVEDEDDDDEGTHGRVLPEPAQALADGMPRRTRFVSVVRTLGRGRHGCARDPRDEDDGKRDAEDLREEGPERSHREEEGAERRPGELVRDEVARLQPRVADTEIGGAHEHRQEGRPGGVGENLRRAVDERRCEHDPDGRRPRHQEHDESRDDDGAGRVRDHDEPAPVVVVGDGSGEEPEQEPRQELHHGAGCHEDRRRRHRRDQQRRGRERDTVTEIARPG